MTLVKTVDCLNVPPSPCGTNQITNDAESVPTSYLPDWPTILYTLYMPVFLYATRHNFACARKLIAGSLSDFSVFITSDQM